MKDAPTPNLTSLAASVRLLAAILKTIFQISRSYISGTVRHKLTKFEQEFDFNIFYTNFMTAARNKFTGLGRSTASAVLLVNLWQTNGEVVKHISSNFAVQYLRNDLT